MNERVVLYSTDLYTGVLVDGTEATVGFSRYANDRMEEMVALEFKECGTAVSQGEPLGAVDVMKALIDIPAALTGVITAVNPRVIETPDLSKEDPFGEGWLVKLSVTNTAELAGLLSQVDFDSRVGGG